MYKKKVRIKKKFHCALYEYFGDVLQERVFGTDIFLNFILNFKIVFLNVLFKSSFYV